MTQQVLERERDLEGFLRLLGHAPVAEHNLKWFGWRCACGLGWSHIKTAKLAQRTILDWARQPPCTRVESAA